MKLSSLKNTKVSKKTVIRFFITGIIIFLLIIVYKYIDKNFQISIEIWVGLATTIGTTYYQAKFEQNKTKIEENSKEKEEIFDELNAKITAVSNSLRRFETRIDSVLLSVKKLENLLTESVNDLENLENKVNENEAQLLKDRFEIYRIFFKQILEIKTDLARIQGIKETPVTVDSMLSLIEAVVKKDAET